MNTVFYRYVGKPIFTRDKMYDVAPAGVCMGLAWTSHGGSTLYIETIQQRPAKKGAGEGSGGGIEYTGNLGDVMKESIRIAYTFAQVYLGGLDPDNEFLATHKVHLHVP